MQRRICLTFLFFPFSFLLASAQMHEANVRFLREMNSAIDNAVLFNDQQSFIPLKQLDKRKIVSIHFGFAKQNIFDSLLNKYDFVDTLDADKYRDSTNLYDLEDGLKYFNTIIVALDNAAVASKKVQQFIQDISSRKDIVIALFGEGKNLALPDKINVPLIWCKDTGNIAAFVVPQMIFGGIALKTSLAKTFSAKYSKGTGFKTLATRLKFTVPEEVNVDVNDLKAIDSIAAEAIEKKAAPGMVVLAAKDGKVFFNKAYGTHTFDDSLPDKITDLFDLASVTKITATTPVVMHLYEEGKLNLDTTIGYYIARARSTPMNPIHVREVMLHQAGFVPFIPFYKYLKPADFSRDSSDAYPIKVADSFYMRKDFFNAVMWPQMMYSPIVTRGKYVYSDLSMYTMQQIVEQLTGTPLNQFALDSFYAPLGMQSAGYLPRNRFAKEKIIPTQNDTVLRHQLLDGYVHDEGAALKGGVAGHAGLFASSVDLAIYYQMLLNKGSYGGRQYFKSQTVAYFTAKRSGVSRRGLGFDRADTSEHYPSQLASAQAFGHTGFTGIGVWVDPSRKLVYIFLSNRVNPQVNNELLHLNIRSRIEDVLNKAIDNGAGMR